MARYIDADALIEMLNNKAKTDYEMGLYNHGALTESFIRCVEKHPTADVVERKRGEWILFKPRRENRNATYKCSVCKKLCSSYYNDVGEWMLCPHCGADMRGEKE